METAHFFKQVRAAGSLLADQYCLMSFRLPYDLMLFLIVFSGR